MKKIISLMLLAVIVVVVLSGCSSDEVVKLDYTDDELKVIDMANQLIEKEYDVKIENGDYSFGVVRQVNEKEFVGLNSETKSEKEYENNVYVTAQINKEPKEGQLLNYGVIFNRETLEIINITATVD